MKKSQQLNFSIMLFLSIALMLCSIFQFYISFMIVLTILIIKNLISIFCFKNKSETYSLFTNLIITLTYLVLNFTGEILCLPFCLLLWIIAESFKKIPELDEIYPKSSKIWLIKITNFFILLTLGFLSSISLFYFPIHEMLILGFYFFVIGIFSLNEYLIES